MSAFEIGYRVCVAALLLAVITVGAAVTMLLLPAILLGVGIVLGARMLKSTVRVRRLRQAARW